MKLQWTPTAKADRRKIAEHVAVENPTAALLLDQLFVQKALHLLDHPGMARPGRVTGTRELVVHKNYIIVYELYDANTVAILRVLHAAQQWPPADQ